MHQGSKIPFRQLQDGRRWRHVSARQKEWTQVLAAGLPVSRQVQDLGPGVYPQISLKDAREKRRQSKLHLDNNLDPSEVRKEEKLAMQVADFEAVARRSSGSNPGSKHNIDRDYPMFCPLYLIQIIVPDSHKEFGLRGFLWASGSVSRRSSIYRITRFSVLCLLSLIKI